MNATDRDRMLLDEGVALRRLARSLLAAADVDDVVQQTFVTALAEPAGGGGYLRAWLRVTLRRLAASRRRAESRRQARERAVAVPEAQHRDDPAVIAQQAEVIRDVGAAVHALHEPFRTAVVMRFWRGLLPEAIAEELGVSRNTVRSRLQRGVEMVRARLDRRHGTRPAWAVPLAGCIGTRAVAPVATTTSALWFVAMIMQTKFLLGAAAVLVAAVAIPWWLVGGAATPTTNAPTRQVPVAVVASGPRRPNERVAVAAQEPVTEQVAGGAEGPFDPSPVQVDPWMPDLLVVDELDVPVAGAVIDVFAGTKVERSAELRAKYGGGRHSYSGREPSPRLQVETDANGRARPLLDLENHCFAAHKQGLGKSVEAMCWHERTVELKLVLVPDVVVPGRVLRADGLPAAGAEVTAGPSSSPTTQIPTDPVRAGGDGRFQLLLHGHGDWSFRAMLDGERAFPLRVAIEKEPVAELLLVLPGAISVTGVVVDPAGRAVAGARVRLWREYRLHDEHQDPDDYESALVESDASGHFRIPVQRFARYQVLASAAYHAPSELLWLETSNALPHADARIMLQPFSSIGGRVVREGGGAFAGVKVRAVAESGEATRYSAVPCRDDLYPPPEATTSAADGSFRLAVTPGTTWQIRTSPDPGNRQLGTCLPGVVPGQMDLLLCITDDDLAGCVVRGAFVSAIDGEPVADQRIALVSYGSDGRPAFTVGCHAKVEGNRFELPPLPLGRMFGLRISTGDLITAGTFADAFVGPFTTVRQGIELVVRLEAWVDLPVRVLNADGSVPRDLSVYASSEVMYDVSYPMLHVDAEGRLLLQKRNPGVHHLRVFAGGKHVLHEQDVTIVAGRNQELTLRLPAPAVDKPR